MEFIISTLIAVVVVLWMHHMEVNSAKSREALERIEKHLEAMSKKENK